MKKYAIVFLSVFLIVSSPFAAHANIVTTTGKYLINAVKHVKGGAQVSATNTVTGAKHIVKHGVSSQALGQGVGAGIIQFGVAGGLGLAFQAITGLALNAVDWVMDKENNSIKWKEKGVGSGSGSGGALTANDVVCRAEAVSRYGAGHSWAVAAVHKSRFDSLGKIVHSCYRDNTYSQLLFNLGGSLFVDDSVLAPVGYKYIPIDTVAQKVIEQADGGQVDSQKTIEDYVTNLAKEGELDAELDASTDITKPEGTEPEPKPDEPVKCPPGTVDVEGVCMGKSDTDDTLWCNSSDFSKKICDWIDWTQEKPDDLKPDAGNVDVIDKSKDLAINENRIDFSNQCPSPTPINTSVGGFPISTELNYQPLCDFFIMLNPFVIGMGGISSALIIAGGVRRG